MTVTAKPSHRPIETTHTLRNPPYAYLRLSIVTSSPPNSAPIPLDEVTLRSYLFAALGGYLGITGEAVAVGIEVLAIEGREAWVRIARDDEMAVVAALGQYGGGNGSGTGGANVAIRVKGRGTWLGGLLDRSDDAKLWSLET